MFSVRFQQFITSAAHSIRNASTQSGTKPSIILKAEQLIGTKLPDTELAAVTESNTNTTVSLGKEQGRVALIFQPGTTITPSTLELNDELPRDLPEVKDTAFHCFHQRNELEDQIPLWEEFGKAYVISAVPKDIQQKTALDNKWKLKDTPIIQLSDPELSLCLKLNLSFPFLLFNDPPRQGSPLEKLLFHMFSNGCLVNYKPWIAICNNGRVENAFFGRHWSGVFEYSKPLAPTFSPDLSYYEILGISNHSTPQQIKEAYLNQAKKYHPGSHLDHKATYSNLFQLVNQAYSVLSNPIKRREYDLILESASSDKKSNFRPR